MKIINKTKNNIIAPKGRMANTFWTRAVGLLNRDSLPTDEALIITRCQSIHMFFMRFAIDVIFVDKKNYVVGFVKRIKPFRLSPIFFKASYAIELIEGAIAAKNVSVGDELELIK